MNNTRSWTKISSRQIIYFYRKLPRVSLAWRINVGRKRSATPRQSIPTLKCRFMFGFIPSSDNLPPSPRRWQLERVSYPPDPIPDADTWVIDWLAVFAGDGEIESNWSIFTRSHWLSESENWAHFFFLFIFLQLSLNWSGSNRQHFLPYTLWRFPVDG